MGILKKESLCDQIIDSIINLIQTEQWKAGEKLSGEFELAASFQVSRNIMREALKILGNFGILDSRNGIGTFVSECAIENIQNMNFFYSLKNNTSVERILEMRLMLEPWAAYFAAQRIEEEGIAKLQELSEELLKKYREVPAYQDDFELHMAIAHFSGNEMCEQLISSLLNQLQNSLYAEFNRYSSQKTKEENLATHIAVLDAIIHHKATLARQLMEDHLLNRLRLINPDFETNTGLELKE